MYKLFSLFFWGILLLCSCVKDENIIKEPDPDTNGTALRDTSMTISVKEPSGLAFAPSKDALYTVSDNTGKIYKVSFKGIVLDELPFAGDDLEGIDVDKSNGDIWVVEEGLQHISHLSSNGLLINTITSVYVSTITTSGFEGIAKNGDTLYILIEKSPGTLIKYNIISNTWSQSPLNFAVDYSGIDYDTSDSTLWIVSDESKTLNHCTLNGKLIDSQQINVNQAEGVCIDRQTDVAWIVSDSGNKLYRITLKI